MIKPNICEKYQGFGKNTMFLWYFISQYFQYFDDIAGNLL